MPDNWMQIINMVLDILGTLCLNVSLYWHAFLLTLINTFQNLIDKFQYFGIIKTLQKIQRTKQNYSVSSNNMYWSIFLSIIQEISNFHANLKFLNWKCPSESLTTLCCYVCRSRQTISSTADVGWVIVYSGFLC